MTSEPHILIVDDNREIRDLVSRLLTREGFRVSAAADGRAMRKTLADARIDLVLLDLMLPGEDGLSLCRGIRANSRLPIIMLTAKGDEVDRVIGLEMGADDYLAKPFGSRELVARIRAVLRRSASELPAAGPPPAEALHRFQFDRWQLDTRSWSATPLLAGTGGVLAYCHGCRPSETFGYQLSTTVFGKHSPIACSKTLTTPQLTFAAAASWLSWLCGGCDSSR